MQVRYKTYPHAKHWFGMGIYHPAMFVHKDEYGAIWLKPDYDDAYVNLAAALNREAALRELAVITRLDQRLAQSLASLLR